MIWGLSFVAARMVLTTLSPVTLATLRFIIASILYTIVIIRELIRGNKPSLNDLKDLAFLGFLSISIYFWLQYIGVQYAGAGISAVLVVGLIPILTGFSSKIILKENVSTMKSAGLLLGLTGVIFIALPKLIFGSIDLLFFIGVGCLLGNAVCFAVYSTMSRRLIQRIGKPLIVTAYTTVLGTLILLPLSLMGDWNAVSLLTQSQWLCVFYLAIACSSIGYLLWNYSLSKLEAVKASVWLYLEPVAAFTGEAILFGILPSPMTLLGGLAIFLGAIIINREK
ncbi:MAG: EamA family transporter [Candidatus Bathyarchaeota archaeon]|nr:EamA family transporter [Candidatus Bathyarchaeota archaeon]